MKTRDLTKMSICIALLSISSYIAFPLPFTPAPVTAQTIIINLLALILTPRQSFVVVSAYILLGICGVPVFAGASAGLGVVFGPTGGFILGFLLAAPLMSLLKGNEYKVKKYLIITILVGTPIIYICGTISMCVVLKMNVIAALTVSVLPFIFGDILKCIAASVLGVKLNETLGEGVKAY